MRVYVRLTVFQVCGTNDHVGYFMCNGNPCPQLSYTCRTAFFSFRNTPSRRFYFTTLSSIFSAVDTDKAVEVRDAIAVCQFSRRTRIIHPK